MWNKAWWRGERWLFSCMLPPCRCTSVLPSAFFSPVKFLTSEARSPPKRPLNGYMRYVQQQKPLMARQNPGMYCHTAGWSAWMSRRVNIQTGKGLNLVYMKAVKWQWWAEALRHYSLYFATENEYRCGDLLQRAVYMDIKYIWLLLRTHCTPCAYMPLLWLMAPWQSPC